MEELTQTQRQMLEFIKSFTAEQGFPPSIREIGRAFRIASTNGVRYHLTALARKGYIERLARTFRGIRVPGAIQRPLSPLPVLGRVAAGSPTLAVEDVECEIGIDRSAFVGGDEGTLFGLRVQGESMRDIGILDGDIAVVRRQETAINGDIVVALVEDEATVKRYQEENGTLYLLPENPAYQPLIFSARDRGLGFTIVGKVVGIIRTNL